MPAPAARSTTGWFPGRSWACTYATDVADDEAGAGDDPSPEEPGQESIEPIEPTPSARDLGIDPSRTLVVVDWVSYAHLVIALVVLLAIAGVTSSATDSLTKIVIGAVLALALDMPVRGLQNRGLPRGAAVAAVWAVAFTMLGLVFALLGPPAVREAADFGEQLPRTIAELYEFPVVGERFQEADLLERSEEWMDDLPDTLTTETVGELVGRLALAISSIVQVLLVTLALLLDGEVLVRRARAVLPGHLRGRADRAGRLVYQTLGRYFAGSLLIALMNGTYILGVGLLLGVPLVILAALWTTLTNLIPQIGGFLGGVVFVTLALTQGAVTGVLALVFFVVYMNIENYVLQPAIVGKAVNLSPPTTMLAAIIGGTAGGVPGALVATPLVGSVKALYMAARTGDGDEDPTGPDDGSGQDDQTPPPTST